MRPGNIRPRPSYNPFRALPHSRLMSAVPAASTTIGLDHALAQGNLILSLGKDNTEEEMDYVVESFAKIVQKLRGMSPMWDEFQKGVIDSVIAPTGRGKSFAQRCVRTTDRALMFHAWVGGPDKFRVEAMSGITFNALAKAADSDAKIKGRVNQLLVGAPEQFFDLRTDPDERVNLVADPKHQAEIARLKKLLAESLLENEVSREALRKKW